MNDLNKLDQGWSIFMFTLSLGLLSYIISLFVFRKRKTVSIEEYLFSGNTAILSIASIVGSIFSVAIFFTAITALYRLYGLLIIPATIIPATAGLLLLKRLTSSMFKIENDNNLPRQVVLRFHKLMELSKSPIAFPFYFLIYLLLMIVTEIAAFHNAITYYYPDNIWVEVISYIALLIITAYIFISGFKGALITDLLQIIFILVIVIVISVSLNSTGNMIKIEELTKLPLLSQSILYAIGSSIICITWFSSSPEIILRIFSLNNEKRTKVVFYSSILLFPIIIIVPLVIMILSDIYPVFSGNSEEAFKVWFAFFERSANLIPLLFFMLLTTAFFTTINTYMISLSQIFYSIKGKTILEKFFPKNIRHASIYTLAIALIISTKLGIKLNSILGVYAGSMMIPNFMMLYVYPRFKILNNTKLFSAIWMQLLLAPILIAVFITISNNFEISHLVYPMIPITICIIELFILVINISLALWRRYEKI